MNLVTIDFETFSKVNLKVAGAARYACDKSTEVICLGYSINDDEPKLWKAGDDEPTDLFDAINDGYQVHAFNAYFEYLIWYHVCVYRLGWPKIRFTQWRDIQAVAALFGMPQSLDDCGMALGLDVVKDARGKRLINKLCKPRRPSKNNPATRWLEVNCPDDYQDFYNYCLQDVRAEIAVRRAFPHGLTPRELKVWRLTMKQNIRGLPIDKDLVENVIRLLKEEEKELTTELIRLTGGAITTGGQLARMIEWASSQGVEIMSMTASAVMSQLKKTDLPQNVRRMLEIRQLLSRSSVKKFLKMRECICPDGKIHGTLKYHTAPTGRWGGALIQPQNLPRATVPDVDLTVQAFSELEVDEFKLLFGDISTMATTMIRPAIKAPEGYVLYDGDYSSIENCTVLWLAEDERALNLIRNGEDLYIDMATRLYPRKSYQWIKESYEHDKAANHMRRHGKLTILGSVYGMGWKTFMATCENFGFPIEDDEAKRTIYTFRETYPLIVDLWSGLERAAIQAIKNPGKISRYRKVRFLSEGSKSFMYMILPNGKRIAYHKPSLELRETPWGKMKLTVTHGGWVKNPYKNRGGTTSAGNSARWGQVGLSPGRLTENASQGLAREVLVDGLLALEDEGYKTILSVHDEPIALMPVGSKKLDNFIQTMCQISPEHKTLPIKAGGFISERFKK